MKAINTMQLEDIYRTVRYICNMDLGKCVFVSFNENRIQITLLHKKCLQDLIVEIFYNYPNKIVRLKFRGKIVETPWHSVGLEFTVTQALVEIDRSNGSNGSNGSIP